MWSTWIYSVVGSSLDQGIIQENATASLTFAEQRPWIERTGWDETFFSVSYAMLKTKIEVETNNAYVMQLSAYQLPSDFCR